MKPWAARDALVARFVKEDAGKYKTAPELNPWTYPTAEGDLPDGSYVYVYMHLTDFSPVVKAKHVADKLRAERTNMLRGHALNTLPLDQQIKVRNIDHLVEQQRQAVILWARNGF